MQEVEPGHRPPPSSHPTSLRESRMSKREALKCIGDRVTLPTIPEVVIEINNLIDDPTSGVSEIGAVVARDPAIAARVLKIANSTFYGLSEPVVSTEDAASVLGAESLRNIALQASVMKRYECYAHLPDFDLEDLWAHSILNAQLSRALARLVPGLGDASPEEFFTCGLLHDVGKVLLIDGLGEEYLDVVRHARRVGKALHVVERDELGYSHVEVGALLARRWELPDAVAAAIEYHHGPGGAILGSRPVAVVAIADQVAYRVQSRTFEAAAERLAALAQRVLGIAPAEFHGVLELARNRAETAGAW